MFDAVNKLIDSMMTDAPTPVALGGSEQVKAEHERRVEELSYILSKGQFLFGRNVASFLEEVKQEVTKQIDQDVNGQIDAINKLQLARGLRKRAIDVFRPDLQIQLDSASNAPARRTAAF